MNASKIIGLLGLLTIVLQANAQFAGSDLMHQIQYLNTPGKVTINQHPDITNLINKHLHDESQDKSMNGFRIRIFANSGSEARKQGELTIASFITHFGKVMRIDFVFDPPFYLVYVGDFRTESEATKVLKEVEKYFPEAWVVRSKIRYPKLN